MAQDIKPTRSELLKLKKQIKLANSGYSLLKKKRDGLILEFFEILKKAKTLREELVNEYKVALEKINIARTLEGDLKVKSIAMAIKDIPDINLITRNIMGVKVPVMRIPETTRNIVERGYGFFDTSAQLDEAAYNFERSLQSIVALAEIEETVKRLAMEVEKTKRRVNALEYIVIPRLKATAKYIQMNLDEMARDSFLRLKKIKAVLDEKAAEKSA